MYGYIYKITNNINGKIYIGQKKCKKENMTEYEMLNDNYWGSGVYITRAEEKYGLENFTKEIVCVCENKEKLDETETLLITLAKAGYGENCYNIAAGGYNNPFEYKTDEEMKEINAKKSETWNNKSEEEKTAAVEKRKETMDNKSEEEKAAISAKLSEASTKQWENKTEEEKAAINAKRSESQKKACANYTDEEKTAKVEKWRETMDNKSEEEKAETSRKISESCTKYHNITMFNPATLKPLQTFATFKEAHQYLLDNNITTNKSDGLHAYLKYACDNHVQKYGYFWSFNTFIETDNDEKDLFDLCEEE